MRRRLLITCGALLVAIPLLWIALLVAGSALAFWFDYSYPSRYGIGILVLTSIIGLVMLVAGLDIISSAKDSK
jgi:hypothetical protein